MRTTTFIDIDESIQVVPAANRIAAAAGVTGPGFGTATRSGTVASAADQIALTRGGQVAAVRNTLTDMSATGEREALILAVIDRVLTQAGFVVRWTASVAGATVQLFAASDEAYTALVDADDVECELDFDGSDAELVTAADEVLSTVKSVSGLLNDSNDLAGYGGDFEQMLFASRVASVSIRPATGALGVARRAAMIRIEALNRLDNDIFSACASDLATCPVCGTSTERADEVCTNGHPTTATVRAHQGFSLACIIAQVTGRAAPSLNLSIEAKVKGFGRVVIPNRFTDLTADQDEIIGLLVESSSLHISFTSEESDPYKVLGQINKVKEGIEAAYAAFNATEVASRDRMARATAAGLDKAADVAASDIAYSVALDVAAGIDLVRQAQFDAKVSEAEAKDRAQVAKLPAKTLKVFAAGVNQRGSLADPNAPRRGKAKRNAKARVNPRDQKRSQSQHSGARRPR
jgi:hypothetical protein